MNETYIKDYINLFNHLSLNNVEQFDNCIDKDIMFSDPFNYVQGSENFKKIFYHMFKNVKDPSLLDFGIFHLLIFHSEDVHLLHAQFVPFYQLLDLRLLCHLFLL